MGWNMKIIYEPKELIGQYVALKQNRPATWGLYTAFGLLNKDEKLIAGIIFNGFTHPNIMMHISAERITPGFIATAMHYAFVKLDCKRITGVIEKENKDACRFAVKLGMQLEGIMRDATIRDDLCIYGLLKANAQKWIKPKYLKKLEDLWVS
jgi:RimJ/RimL family protein N-acetyltransferase